MGRKRTPAEQARISAGYSLQEAARKLNLSSRYLRQIELHGQAPLKLARRLAQLYRCSGNTFLYSPSYLEQLGQRAAELSTASHATAGADTLRHDGTHDQRAGRRYRPAQSPQMSLVPKSEHAP